MIIICTSNHQMEVLLFPHPYRPRLCHYSLPCAASTSLGKHWSVWLKDNSNIFIAYLDIPPYHLYTTQHNSCLLQFHCFLAKNQNPVGVSVYDGSWLIAWYIDPDLNFCIFYRGWYKNTILVYSTQREKGIQTGM